MDVLSVGYETGERRLQNHFLPKMKQKRAAKEPGFDLIIAAGGDGTINSGQWGCPGLENRPQMAFIPTSTTNDYARTLKIPMGDPVAKAAHALLKKSNHSDGYWSCIWRKYFINIAAAEPWQNWPSVFQVVLNLAWSYFAYGRKLRQVRIEHDNGVFEEAMQFCGFDNSIAGFESVAPNAKRW